MKIKEVKTEKTQVEAEERIRIEFKIEYETDFPFDFPFDFPIGFTSE